MAKLISTIVLPETPTGEVYTDNGSFQPALSIGSVLGSGDPNRVIYVDSTGEIAQSANFVFNGSKLQVGGVVTPLFGAEPMFSLGSSTPITLGGSNFFGSDHAFVLNDSGNGKILIGDQTRVYPRGTSTNSTIIGHYVFMDPNDTAGDYSTNAIMGVYSWINVDVAVNSAIAGLFTASHGSSASSGTPLIVGVRGSAGIAHNGTCDLCIGGDFKITAGTSAPSNQGMAICIAGQATNRNAINIEELRGISLHNWNNAGGTTELSIGIYIDNTINFGAEAYTIYSESISPSVFAGSVEVPPQTYGVSWDGNNTVPTKHDIYTYLVNTRPVQVVFNVYTDIATTTAGSLEDIHTYTIPSDLLAEDGDSLNLRYSGRFDTSNAKEFVLVLGDDYFGTVTSAIGNWTFDIDLVRVNSTTYSAVIKFFVNEGFVDVYKSTIAVVDFTTNEDLILQISDTNIGETVLEVARGVFFPAT